MRKVGVSILFVTLIVIGYFLLGLLTNYATFTMPRTLAERPALIWILSGVLLFVIIALTIGEQNLIKKRDQTVLRQKRARAEQVKEPGEMGRWANDVFISYSHKDKDWVSTTLVPKLRSHGFSVLIDTEFIGGSFGVVQMEEGVEKSKRVVAVLTPDYIRSEWATFENVMATVLDPAAIRRKLIPVLLKDTDFPLRLRVLHYRDLRNNSSEEWDRLVEDLI